MTKQQAGNEKMLNEMKEAMAQIMKKYDIDSYKMSSFVSYGVNESKISFSFTEINDNDMMEEHLKTLRYGNIIAQNVTVEMFKAVTIPGAKNTTLRVTGIKPGRPYKVILTAGQKEYTMIMGVFLDKYAQHLRPKF